jgi:hypothetical protein
MNCTHHWTVTSPCPDCQQDELKREMLSNAELNDKIAKLREAIAAWPRSSHRHNCKMLEPVGGFYLETRCTCGAAQADAARAEARKLAGLEAAP